MKLLIILSIVSLVAGIGVVNCTGTNAADFVSRIGVAQSSDDGGTWTSVGSHVALIGKGVAGQPDEGGVACPSPVDKGDGTEGFTWTKISETGGIYFVPEPGVMVLAALGALGIFRRSRRG